MVTEKILPHIIDIKEKVAGIEEHLKTLNGSVARQQTEINIRRERSEMNSQDINQLKITMAKWTGGAMVIMTIINIFITRLFL